MTTKRVLFALAFTAAGLGLPACGGEGDGDGGMGPPGQAPLATVEISPGNDTLTALAATRQLSATVKDADGNVVTGVTLTWQSSNESIATVSATGLVTAVANGNASISATATRNGESASGSAQLRVEQRVTNVTVTPANATIGAGMTQQFTAAATDANNNPVIGVNFLWVTSDHNIATIDQNGLAAGSKVGQATVIAVGQGEPGSAGLSVVAGSPTTLAFTVPPAETEPGLPIAPAVQVAIRDDLGNTATNRSDAVTLAIETNPGGAMLLGTLTVDAVNGIATFDDLSVDRAGGGLTLVATSGALSGATSPAFDVFLTFTAVGEGVAGNHQCGVTTKGNAYCWGAGTPLGDGTNNPSTVPVLVVGGHTFAQVSVGGSHSCAVTVDGDAYCWGFGMLGRLGNGTTTPQTMPVPVSGGHTFAYVSAGGSHTCGVTTNGDAYCWGNGGNGRLGDGGTADQTTPALVLGGHSFLSVSAGSAHSCGVTTGGDAYCWGFGGNGRLGNGGTADTTTPALVAGMHSFLSVSAGGGHSCGVRADNVGLCWGLGTSGQLGQGATNDQLTPVGVVDGYTFAKVSAGFSHTCGVGQSGAGRCWGANVFGSLGNGTSGGNFTTAQLVLGGHVFASISALTELTCGVTTGGSAYCWGTGNTGQRGDGSKGFYATVPVKVVGSR